MADAHGTGAGRSVYQLRRDARCLHRDSGPHTDAEPAADKLSGRQRDGAEALMIPSFFVHFAH